MTLPKGHCLKDVASRTLPQVRCLKDVASRTLPQGRCLKDVASKPLMLETPHASNSWAKGPWARAHGPLGPSLGPGPRGGEAQAGGCCRTAGNGNPTARQPPA